MKHSNFIKKFSAIILFCIALALLTTAQSPFKEKLSDAGISLSKDFVTYDGSYRNIKYPNGDVPPHIGVCTDVIIRAYRKVGIDLQKLIHEDIITNRSLYKGIKKPDTNIDHRRVPNMCKFFKNNGKSLTISDNPKDYKPGDIIWWKIGGPSGMNHVGLVVNKKSTDGKRYLVVHNIGGGQNIDDFLFRAYIHGHYSYQ